MTRLVKQNKWIEKSQNKFGDKFDYSKVNYVNNKTKVIIICNIHGEFYQNPCSHLNGHGCQLCARKITSNKKSINAEVFFNRAKEKHSNKYDYSKSIFCGLKREIIIICPFHGEFTQKAGVHLQYGCTKCKNDAARSKIEDIIIAFNVMHNDKYTYYDFNYYINNKQIINITCPIHNIFQMRIDGHSQGKGCPKCKRVLIKNNSFNNFVAKSNLIHNNFYDYIPCDDFSVNSLVLIVCPKHNQFIQLAWQHMNGNRCKECSKEDRRLSLCEFINKSNEKHNNKYNYSEVSFAFVSEKIKIKCNLHGYFFQSVAAHMRGQGCPKCSKIISRGETEWLDSLNIPKINRNRPIIVNSKFYFPDGINLDDNIIYEYYGDFWHGNPKIYDVNAMCSATKLTFGEMYNHTMKREEALMKAGYKLITIWEHEWQKHEIK